MAATISVPGTASATPHHHAYFQRVRSGVRAASRSRFVVYRPRLAAARGYRAGFGRGRLALRHPLARRAVAWQRPLLRRRIAAYAPATSAAPGAGLLGAVPNVAAPTRRVARASGGAQTGQASFYRLQSRTANGGRVGAATCAHRSLPFGTRVLVTNLANAHQAVLTVNDRGPFVRGRIVDVSVGAAGMLGMLGSGTAPVRVQVVGGPG